MSCVFANSGRLGGFNDVCYLLLTIVRFDVVEW